MVVMLEDPETNKSIGAAYLDCGRDGKAEDLLPLNGEQFDGRKVFIQKDSNNEHIKKFAEKKGYSVDFRGKYGQAVLSKGVGKTSSSSGPMSKNDNQNSKSKHDTHKTGPSGHSYANKAPVSGYKKRSHDDRKRFPDEERGEKRSRQSESIPMAPMASAVTVDPNQPYDLNMNPLRIVLDSSCYFP